MSPLFMAGRSRCAPACPSCTRRFRRESAVSNTLLIAATILAVLALVFASRWLAVAGAAAMVPAGVFRRRALRSLGEIRAAEATARRYGGRR